MTDHNPSGGAGLCARALVLGGPVLTLFFTLHVLVTGSGAQLPFAVWFWAVLCNFLAALAGALWRGIHHGDWSAFRRYEFPEDDGERFDWSTRTGRYAWRRDYEEGGLHGNDDFPGHGPIT